MIDSNKNIIQCVQCNAFFHLDAAAEEYFKKFGVMNSELCSQCKKIQLMCWRNERTFYPAVCSQCQTAMISCFNPEYPAPVMCNDCWWSSDFDPLQYGRDYDFSRPFFEQFKDLMNEVPVGNLFIANSDNSEYSQLAVGNKNCYMALASDYNEDSLYMDASNYNKDVCDVSFCNKNELCYNSIDIESCYACNYCQGLKNCNSCWFSVDCSGSSNLLGCVGVRNSSYVIFNEQYNKEEYEAKLAEYTLHTYSGKEQFTKEFAEFLKTQPRKYAQHINCEKCTGNYLSNCSECVNAYDIIESENCIDSIFGYKITDARDIYGSGNVELAYYSCALAGGYNIMFSSTIWPGSENLLYCFLGRTIKNCFGSVSLHNNEYIILNKQYTKEEYETLLPKIIEHLEKTGEWGNFFPMGISPWAYNETIAMDFYPKTKEESTAIGARWNDNTPGTFGKETITNIPDSITDVTDTITKQILACAQCKKNYRIIEQEFKFLQTNNLPIPRTCPTCRYHRRIALRNPRELWDRQCMCDILAHDHHSEKKCSETFRTTYQVGRPEILYCDDCYRTEYI